MRQPIRCLWITVLLGFALAGCGFNLPGMLQPEPGGPTAANPATGTPTPSRHSVPPPSQSVPQQTPSTKASSAATPADSAIPAPDPGTRVVQGTAAFTSPTGRIVCLMDGTQVRCEYLAEADWNAPKPADCSASAGRTLVVAAGSQAGCGGDTLAGSAKPGSPETGWFDQSKDTVSNHDQVQQAALGYGQRLRVGGFECLSESRGVTCTNVVTKAGLFISRESYELF